MLCSSPIDDLVGPIRWDVIAQQLALAANLHWVLILHAHTPGVTVSPATIDRVLTMADDYGLSFFTFRELVPTRDPPGGLALAFDDDTPDQWVELRDIFAKHHAHVTFFVTRWNALTSLGRSEIALLAADGHDIEPHSTNHVRAPEYVAQHGLTAYLDDEVIPSIDVLVDAGYPTPTAFAYPWGEHTEAIDNAVLEHVDRVRVTPRWCPY